jgi:hypothetical protein
MNWRNFSDWLTLATIIIFIKNISEITNKLYNFSGGRREDWGLNSGSHVC